MVRGIAALPGSIEVLALTINQMQYFFNLRMRYDLRSLIVCSVGRSNYIDRITDCSKITMYQNLVNQSEGLKYSSQPDR